MTEQEAIEIMEEVKSLDDSLYAYDPAYMEALEIVITDLEEIQQYRKIGTVEELKKTVKEEDVLKFYYCESEDDYYIGKRVENFYYARYGETGFEWFMSRYLPWGEHVVKPNTLWKEYTYPSEPKEIPFFEWLQGFLKKYCGGTVEEIKQAIGVLSLSENDIIETFHELNEYRKIGTVEECREAVEKQRTKKIIIRDWNPTKCPTCGHELSTSLGDGYYKHPIFLERCPECGQAIQWDNLEGMEDE